MKGIPKLKISKEGVLHFLQKGAAFWRKNMHWVFTLIFVGISSFAAYEWYVYSYDLYSTKGSVKEELRKLERGEFNQERFDSVIERIQKRKTDYVRGIIVDRDIFVQEEK